MLAVVRSRTGGDPHEKTPMSSTCCKGRRPSSLVVKPATCQNHRRPDELRGSSIRAGQTRQIAKGDVIIVPHGVPHQFLEVTKSVPLLRCESPLERET